MAKKSPNISTGQVKPRKRPNPGGEELLAKPGVLSKSENKTPGFPIIGMGASAGGLEAFEQFFRAMPPDSGMAFVLVSHLDPNHVSLLTEILQRSTAMPVVEARDRMVVEPGHVYVIQPNREMVIFRGVLHLSVPEASRGMRMPIDIFLRSLADEQGEQAIGVILSGTGTDGTLGLRAIHGAGGVSFAQEPSGAKYDGMPVSAIKSGLAMYVLPADKMPEQLLIYVKTLFKHKIKPATPAPAIKNALNKILLTLRSGTGHDFSLYKKSTIGRRIDRRMAIHGIDNMNAYSRYLQENPQEVQLLFKELLINVTSFFRDPESFEALKKDILPQILVHKPENYVFRVWVAGCATGEEAYSIAILLKEFMEETNINFNVQIYSTDIDDDAIVTARSGFYAPNIAIDVSPERLRRFFVKEETGYRVKKEVREMIVFAIQNAIKDPPFTRLDLVSCRNLLIYLEPELQSRLIQAFHYSLKPGGVLFLSSSESIGNLIDLFGAINRKWKFYKAKPSLALAHPFAKNSTLWTGDQIRKGVGVHEEKATEANIAEFTRVALLQSYAPPSVVTDEKGNALYVHGDTGKYLRPAPGHATMNILSMAREGLQMELRTALHTAVEKKKEYVCENLSVRTDGGMREVKLVVRPLTDTDMIQGLLIVSFQDLETPAKKKRESGKKGAGSVEAKRVRELEQELFNTKEELQTALEESLASNEELKSANEELQSTNEELQSSNEELETSKEEIQSVNEELLTVNSELHAKIEQLSGLQNDMKNLLDTTNIGTIFVDENMAIRRFSREAVKVYRLLASDTGRPLSDIKSSIVGIDLVEEAQAVLASLVPREKEVWTTGKDCYLVRLMPYRTLDNVIQGVVMTFTEITRLKKIEDEVSDAKIYAENIVDTIREALIVLDADLKVLSANRAFYRTFKTLPVDTVGHYLYELGNRQWDVPQLRDLLGTVLPRETSFDNFEIENDFQGIGRRRMLMNARCVLEKSGHPLLILLAMEDITDRSA